MTLTLETAAIVALLGLLAAGLYGLMIVRNVIKLVAVIQILVKGALIALVLSGRLAGQLHLGQSLAITVIVADTVVAVIGLALAVQARKRYGTLDTVEMSTLKG